MTCPGLFSRRGLRWALVLLAIAYALLGGLHTIGDFDSGWLMAIGRWVLAHRAIPGTDVLSYTSPGTPWHYPPFAGVLLYTIFSAWGYTGLSWFCALAGAAVVALVISAGSGEGNCRTAVGDPGNPVAGVSDDAAG